MAKKKKAKKVLKKKVAKKSISKKTKKPAAKKSAAKASPKTPAKIVTKSQRALLPLEDRLLIEILGASEKTAGGIIIPGTASERPHRGRVLAKGPGRRNKKGQRRPLDVKVGDEVLFAEYAGTKITFEGSEALILREDEVLGIATA